MQHRNVKRFAYSSMAAFLVLGGFAPIGYADNPLVEIAGMELDANQNFHANLRSLQGKRALVILDSGTEIAGRIKLVGQKFVHMERTSPKDFMDVMIRIDRIAALEIQVRGYLRDVERAGLKAKEPQQ